MSSNYSNKIKGIIISLKPSYELDSLRDILINTSERILYDVIVLKATNGKNEFKRVDTKVMNKFYHRFLTPPVVTAIADSHIRAWEIFINDGKTNDDDMCAFFEDDIIIKKEDSKIFPKILDGSLNEMKKTKSDILFLGCFSSAFIQFLLSFVFIAENPFSPFLKKSSSDLIYTDFPSAAVGAHAYVLSKRGAVNLLQKIKGKLNHYLDYKIQELNYLGEIKVLKSRKRIIYQTSTSRLIPDNCENDKSISCSSSSVKNAHPVVFTRLAAKGIDVDTCVSLNYILSNELYHLFGTPYLRITFMTIFLFIFGIIISIFAYFWIIFSVNIEKNYKIYYSSNSLEIKFKRKAVFKNFLFYFTILSFSFSIPDFILLIYDFSEKNNFKNIFVKFSNIIFNLFVLLFPIWILSNVLFL